MENFNSRFIRIHPSDNVWVAVDVLHAGESLSVNAETVRVIEDIPIGHKVAATEIGNGEKIIKYGISIGSACTDIAAGALVHIHNIKSDYLYDTLDKGDAYD